jgi:hypothetical protein
MARPLAPDLAFVATFVDAVTVRPFFSALRRLERRPETPALPAPPAPVDRPATAA